MAEIKQIERALDVVDIRPFKSPGSSPMATPAYTAAGSEAGAGGISSSNSSNAADVLMSSDVQDAPTKQPNPEDEGQHSRDH